MPQNCWCACLRGPSSHTGCGWPVIAGGTAVNAIPREASALVFLPDTQVEAFSAYVRAYEATIQSELAAVEPDLSVELAAVQPPAQVMDERFQAVLIDALYANPQGVLRMSDAVPGLVETSNNLGIVSVQDGQMQVICFPRSSVGSALQDVSPDDRQHLGIGWLPVEVTDSFAAWTPSPNSPILELDESHLPGLYGQEPEVMAVHAGLECGVDRRQLPGYGYDLDRTDPGDVHSPSGEAVRPQRGQGDGSVV